MSARIETLADRVRREVVLNASPAFQIAVLAFLPFLPFLVHFDGDNPFPASRSSFFIAAGVVLFALLFRWAYFAFAMAFVLLSVLSIHLVMRFGGGPGWQINQPDARVETYFESPSSETLEYFATHWFPWDTAMLAVGLAYLVLLGWALRTRRALSGAAKWTIAVAMAGWVAIATSVGIGQYLDQWPQYQLGYAAFEAQSRVQRFAERGDAIAAVSLPDGDCTYRYRKVVIVLGESVALRHLSAFGYARKTTPFVDRSRPYRFETLAPSNQTRVSLAMMLTPVDTENFDAFYETPSLVSQLASCGYRTLWVSNQGRVGRQDSAVSSIAREADQEVFLNELSYKDVRYDGDLVQELERLGAFEATGQATFIHLIGSHTDYAKRYPRGFGFPQVKRTVDAYDSSLLYTDTVLSELYRRFGPEGLLFIYAPDHGEVVSTQVFGHGFSPGYREEYLTPLMIWTEDDAAMLGLNELLGGRRLNLESLDDVVGFLVGSADTLHASTRSTVSNLSPENTVRYEELRSFHGSKTDE